MAVFPATGSIIVAVLLVCLLAIKSSKVYRKTLQAVQDYDGTTDRLGTPVLPGLLVMGNMSRMPSGLMVSLTGVYRIHPDCGEITTQFQYITAEYSARPHP